MPKDIIDTFLTETRTLAKYAKSNIGQVPEGLRDEAISVSDSILKNANAFEKMIRSNESLEKKSEIINSEKEILKAVKRLTELFPPRRK